MMINLMNNHMANMLAEDAGAPELRNPLNSGMRAKSLLSRLRSLRKRPKNLLSRLKSLAISRKNQNRPGIRAELHCRKPRLN